MSEYNINEDMPKSIFYYDDGKFYFQVFNKRNMLQRKMVLQFECGNIFAKMNNSAFIVEDKIHALYEEGETVFSKLYSRKSNILTNRFCYRGYKC